MPLNLYHGPAGPQKIRKFLEVYAAAPETKLIVVPNHLSGEKFKSLLLKNSCSPILMGTTVMTFEDLLFKLIKLNLHRAHRADELSCCYLLFLLATEHEPALLEQQHFFGVLRDLYRLIHDLKCSGEVPESFFKKFGTKLKYGKLAQIAVEYQKELERQHYLDGGDLYLTTLRLLDSKKSEFLPDLSDVFFIDHYPLHAGQRKILRLLRENFSRLNIHVFYDEDFKRRDDLLSLAYEDLGTSCDRQEYLADAGREQPSVTSFANPVDEALWIAAQIRQKLDDGAKAHEFAIVVTEQTLFDYEFALRQVHIASTSTFTKNIPEILPSQLMTGHSQLPPEKISAWLQQGDAPLYRNIQALGLLDSYTETTDFLKNLFGPLRCKGSQNLEDDFFTRATELLCTRQGALNCKVALCSLQTASELDQREVFVTGLNLEQISPAMESNLLNSELYQSRELAEFLNSPTYQFRIGLEKIFHLISAATVCHLSRFENDHAGRPTTELPNLTSLASPPFLKNSSPAPQKASFTPIIKSTFSLSEIESYLSCPYKYYASHALKLGKLDTEDMEPAADAKGSFVHEILHTFFRQHNGIYCASIIQGMLNPEIPGLLNRLILNSSQKNAALKNFTPEIVAAFTERVSQTLLSLLEREIGLYHGNKKRTLPAHFEWTVETQEQRGFPVTVDGRMVIITARIDRIDVDKENGFFTVIDYKTGSTALPGEIREGRSLQLPFYTLAVKTLLYPQLQTSGAVYYNLGDNKISGFAIKASSDAGLIRNPVTVEDWEKIVANSLGQITAVVQKMAAGEFAPKPDKEKNCDWCDYRRICAYQAQGSDDDTDE